MHLLINTSNEQLLVPMLDAQGRSDSVILQPKGRADVPANCTINTKWLVDNPAVVFHPDKTAEEPSE